MPPPPPDPKKLALKLGTDGPHKVLPTPRKIQVLFNGAYIIKTTKASFVWEHPYYPQLYFPRTELEREEAACEGLNVAEGEEYADDNGKVIAKQLILSINNKSINNVIAWEEDLPTKAAELKGLVKIDFASVDQWFEEDTPIYVHPKDPFKRVNILQSTRHIRIKVGGQVVADTRSSMHLYETGLPVRYYLPLTSIDPGVLRKSKTRTLCPYKGEAEYYSVEVNGEVWEDVVWYYTTPLLESARIEGLCCFYNEKVEIELDGERLEQPDTHFGRHKPSDNVKPSAV
ncbi:hypothetical protein CLAFUW4_09988 [Fulvia fulva]|uniref:DUF427 domain-containing protein n=1 Tax=Passalora fulva TaxID=5499 RepID=A0A9Q8PI38_PASFU|nr:uncharacterized protein CLAFUR5_12255 [Fulvia fulva]KAK4615618.1 hypothetical protein CLAFUR4_09992 [Fulvia fulva]KAK4617121.1 hypothetical protein CLAFUR0_09989 [Fulvia fulva]UJO22926.1 hypothetical protein CLAFUR5_12255 [Fulvia fulva]WPV19141.1 hypothetical protein CLAFUW4_09988 [Fulvia fulva]WPV34321.1 hypothetical protein CLAFUW7_09989 [Fulvia fulva]